MSVPPLVHPSDEDLAELVGNDAEIADSVAKIKQLYTERNPVPGA